MSAKEIFGRPTTKSIASYVKKNALKVQKSQRHQHELPESIRQTDYKGHHVVVRTSYSIEVDGVPVTGHMGVTDDGRVHYHPIPNVSFASALDMVKRLIDVFPDDFAAGGKQADMEQHHMHMSRPPRKQPSAGGRARKAASSRKR